VHPTKMKRNMNEKYLCNELRIFIIEFLYTKIRVFFNIKNE